MSDERKKQIKMRIMFKIKCVLAFTNGYNWQSNRVDKKYVPTLTQERKNKIIKRVMFKLRIIRIFDNRKTDEKYEPIKGARYQPTLTEEKKNLIKKRVMFKIMSVHAFTKGYKWHSNRTDTKYVPTLTE